MTTNESDFSKEDLGKYRHPETIGGIPYAELEAKLLQALDRDIRTHTRIKEFLKLERSVDASALFSGMELDEKISRHSNGTLTAFFRFDQKPLRMWVNGLGTVDAELDETFVPTYREGKPMTRENAEHPFRAPITEPKRGGGKARIDLDPEKVEQAAAEKGNQPEVAKALGIGYSTLMVKLKESDVLRKAYADGKAVYQAKHPDAGKPGSKTAAAIATAEAPALPPPAKIVPEIEPQTRGEIENTPASDEADQRSLEPETDDRDTADEMPENFRDLLAGEDDSDVVRDYDADRPATQVLPVTVEREVEPVKPSRIEMEIDEPAAAPSLKSVAMPGGQLRIGFMGDIFSMPKRDREFLNQLVDLVQEHEAATGN